MLLYNQVIFMEIFLKEAEYSQRGVLNNLLEKYSYEFSQYDKVPFNQDGLYGYTYLDSYFTSSDRFAYFILADTHLAGFCMVNKHAECERAVDWSVAEFFVAYPYRRQGVGSKTMEKLFEKHKGFWNIKYHPKNTASKIFWTKIADKHSHGNYELLIGCEKYSDGTAPEVLFFKI